MDINVLKLPPAKIKQLAEKGIETVEDLLKYFPKTYLDFRNESEVCIDNVNKDIAVIGIVEKVVLLGQSKNVVKCVLTTTNGTKLDVLWFNQTYLFERLEGWKGRKVVVCGKLCRDTTKYFNYTISNPICFSQSLKDTMKIIPVYKKIPGMADDYFKNVIKDAIKLVKLEEYLSDDTRTKFSLCHNAGLFQRIHNPVNEDDINASKRRLIFDDMYYFANKLHKEARGKEDSPFVVSETTMVKRLISSLPYKLTDDQMNTFVEILNYCKQGKRLNALIQGDVGSGKTIVALLSMVLFAENGYQSALLAPTQVLATQHYNDFKKMLEPLGIEVVLLKNKMKVKEKREALAKIESGEAKVVVGTHSLFGKEVVYNNLALMIVDEEHKFGVEQREAVLEKADDGVHNITLSATPIPRTLAMTLYGANKRVFTIAQMPSGRKPVQTLLDDDEERIFSFMYDKIQEGQQCYVVCPFITKSSNEKFENVEDVEEVYERVRDYFSFYGIKAAVVTGSMKAADVSQVIDDFVANKVQILIATTVIEVGVNVPNANVILIKNAERFGLAQLHQLRGRVGRGNQQGYCILQSEDIKNERLSVMCKTNNGFEIAEADLANRGAGDLIGTKQTGDNKYVELMLLYPKFYNKVKKFVENENIA